MTVTPAAPQSPTQRYRRALWLLTARDLRVRYSTSALGYLWSILDPLVMAGIYWFVFAVVFDRGGNVGERPYIVFLLAGLLPWMWFTGAVSDCTRAFLKDAKLVRSTAIPRTIWVNRIVLSKGIEFVAAIPVLLAFALVFFHIDPNVPDGTPWITWGALLFPLGILLQATLTVGVGLIVAPLVVFFRDLERAVKLVLRFMFYASPIVYGLGDLPGILTTLGMFNPLAGVFSLYRAAFFPDQLDWAAVGVSAGIAVLLVAGGLALFRASERAVLKEL